MLRRMSKQNEINFLLESEKIENEEKIKKQLSEDEKIKLIAEEQKSKKLNNNDNGFMTNKHIASMGHSVDTQEKNSSKYIKCETSHSIWGTNDYKSLDDKKITEDMKTYAMEIEENRKEKRKANLNKINNVPVVTGGQVVFAKKDKKNHSFDTLKQNISIFDNEEFGRIPEKTAGEQTKEINIQKKAEKDESWKNNGKSISSKSITDSLFDSLIGNKE